MCLLISQLFGTHTAFSLRSNVMEGCLGSGAKAELRASLTHIVYEGLRCTKGSSPTVAERHCHVYKKRHLVSNSETAPTIPAKAAEEGKILKSNCG